MSTSVLSTDDRDAVARVLHQVAYVLDSHEYRRLDEVFADDIEFDNPGRLTATGLTAVIEAFEKIAAPAVSHHITNLLVDPADADTAHCTSKALALRSGGEVTAAIYRDTVTRTPQGWRVSARRITPLG